jgi:glyoxylase-like metal-dependent hydrolase (beta-lactamase superfamily II)
MKLTLLASGYCTQSEHILFGDGQRRTVCFPALFALLEHPSLGSILFDTGYSDRFFSETERFPFRLYRRITPVFLQPQESAAHHLARIGVEALSVQNLIISHFHADHICGLADFPCARYLCTKEAYGTVRGRRGWRAAQAALLPGLIPPDFERRAELIGADRLRALPPGFAPFSQGYDLFGDGSIWGVPLPGHAHGQIGLLMTLDSGETVFLAADACWHSRAVREGILPAPVTRWIMADWRAYCATFAQLCEFHRRRPDVAILPSHCAEVYADRVATARR